MLKILFSFFHANDYLLLSMCKKLNFFCSIKMRKPEHPYVLQSFKAPHLCSLRIVFTCVSETKLVLHGRCFWIYHFMASWILISNQGITWHTIVVLFLHSNLFAVPLSPCRFCSMELTCCHFRAPYKPVLFFYRYFGTHTYIHIYICMYVYVYIYLFKDSLPCVWK